MTSPAPSIINAAAVEPLYKPWEEPSAHRARSGTTGAAEVRTGRRPSGITLVNSLRASVREWREAFYAGASDTTIQLLNHWFETAHRTITSSGEEQEFRYHYCQREALETLVYLKEVRGLGRLSQVIAEFGGANATVAALGITEEEDAWSRLAFKLATGAGKTKVMSLAIVWSYFHAQREAGSEMARHFVIIAPNLTVYERLKEDFGDGSIFDSDPLIPPEWKGDFNVSTVLQDGAGGAGTNGVIYLTNIHRLHDTTKGRSGGGDTYSWMGPAVSKATALDTGAALRDRVTAHRRVMVLNDEAHHVWDPDSAWNEAIGALNGAIASRTGGGLVAQLDFTATPKDNKGNLFKHIVCDTPLGEAVDAGIVKTPVIGQADQKLEETADENAAYRWDRHLRLGYERWKVSRAEWARSGKKPLMFVMCGDTKAADQITARFNTDPAFEELNGTTLNLHTNLKGKVRKVGRAPNVRYEFFEDEKGINDEDLKALRKLSRDLDGDASPYRCIVSVLMLREGWDVKNVTTIVPLRPYKAKANILPEQTLGRGLRRMTPPGQANEVVTVVEHPAFTSLYQQELAQEGVMLPVVDVERVEPTTVAIFPDETAKDVHALDIALPVLSASLRSIPTIEGLTIEDVRAEFAKLKPLPVGEATSRDIEYEGKHLITGEVVERMTMHLELLATGIGAVSYYVRQLETGCKVRGTHATLGPLVQTFLEEILFGGKVSLFDPAVVRRLGDSDVGEYVRATFVPLIRARTITREDRALTGEPRPLSQWRPFQVTHNETRPAVQATHTLFNLVPCNRGFEVAMAGFLDRAPDVPAFAKNAGSQSLRIDYLATGGRLSFYTPDFFARAKDGRCYLIEVKGREDREVPAKARAAVAWCKAASETGTPWEYVYAPMGAFERLSNDTLQSLIAICAPSLSDLVRDKDEEARKYPLFAMIAPAEEAAPVTDDLLDAKALASLPDRYRTAAEQAAMLFRFLETKPQVNFSPVFSAMLGSMDDGARSVVVSRLLPRLPANQVEQRSWFEPYLGNVPAANRQYLSDLARNLRKTLVFNSGLFPLGLLRMCLDFALNQNLHTSGVLDAVRDAFKVAGGRDLLYVVTEVNDFRNTYVAHQEKDLTDASLAEAQLKRWVAAMATLSAAGAGGVS